MEIGAPEKPAPSYWTMAEAFPEFMDDYTDAVPPVSTTIPELDEMLRGGFRPGVHFIGGNTGAGKTAFCLWLMERIASTPDAVTGRPTGCAFVSLELAGWEVRARLGSRLSYHLDDHVPYSWADFEELGFRAKADIAAGTYDPSADPVYCADLSLMAACPNMRVVDGVKHPRTASLGVIEQEIAYCGSAGGRILFVDYLQCIDVGLDYDEQQAVKEAVRALNLAAMRAGVAVVVIAAVSRAKGTEMRKGAKENPGADIFRGSSWIEYTGLSAFALVRREDAVRTDEYVELELHCVKNRRGDTGEPIQLGYNGRYGEFFIDDGTW